MEQYLEMGSEKEVSIYLGLERKEYPLLTYHFRLQEKKIMHDHIMEKTLS